MEERVSDRANESLEKSREAYPEILRRVRAREDLYSIANDISGRVDVDMSTAYRWVHIVDSEFSRRRRGIATIGATLLWICALSAAAAVAFRLLAPGASLLGLSADSVLFVLAGIAGVPAVYLSRRADALALSRSNPFSDE
ncbi:MAG: hypothetical protein ACLFM0_04290 [Spirochaetales bacterium]